MRVKANALGLIVLAAIFGGIVATSMFNVWNTTSTKEPIRYQTGDFAGEYDPSDIRGSYTFGDIYNAFEVPVEVLGKAFGVEDYSDLAGFQVKNLESLYGDLKDQGKEIGTSSVRVFVGLYTGSPVVPSEEDYLPKAAVDILKEKGNLTEEQLAFVNSHVVDIAAVSGEQTTSAIGNESGEASDERVVKGKTTFYEALSWGITEEQLEELIGGEIPSTGITISEHCRNNGIAFSEVKDALNILLDQ